MTTPFPFLFSILFLSVVVQGRLHSKLSNNVPVAGFPGQGPKCTKENIKITQGKTGIEVVGQSQAQGRASAEKKIPEWQVTIVNDCPCEQAKVKISCTNFQTLEYINPFVLNTTVPGPECFLNDGLPIKPHSDLTFTYAWDLNPYPFKPISSDVAC